MRRRRLLAAPCAAMVAALAGGLAARSAHADLARGLVGTDGAQFELARLRRGATLLTFGFTRCASTCPMSLAHAAGALRLLGAPESSSPVRRIVFVTLDPLSDDASTLARWLARFDSRILGVTGAPGRVAELADQMRVGVRGAGAQLEHSSVWYVIDSRLQVRRTLPATTPSTELAAALRSALEGS